MSEQKASARPRQVTTAGVMGVVGSALVVLSLFDALQRLRSVEMREAVTSFLAEPPGDGLGISTARVLDLLHGLVLFNGALAAVAAVLAVYLFQRHQGARIGFSVAAGLLLLTSPFSGGAMAMIVAFAATMLWSRPARDWFAGRDPAAAGVSGNSRTGPHGSRPDPWAFSTQRPDEQRPGDPGASQDAQGHDSTRQQAPGHSAAGPGQSISYPAQHPAQQPAPASYPYGNRPDPHWAPPGHDQQPSAPAWATGTGKDPDRRPVTVTVAAAITWAVAGLSALMFFMVVLMLMFAQDPLVEALRADARFDELGVSVDDLLAVVWVVAAVALFWSVSAVVLAFLAFRRLGWARVLLAVSAGVTCLVSVLAIPAGLLMLVPAAVVLGLLFSGGANAWYSRTSGSAPPPSAGPYGGPPSPQRAAQQPPAQRPGKPPVW